MAGRMRIRKPLKEEWCNIYDHRAQELVVLNQYFGIQTVEQDMILYLTESH
jgi:hypothetical protein